MNTKKILILGLIPLLLVGCGRKDQTERIRHKKEEEYEFIDNNYDFYSRDKITITMMAPKEEGYSNDLIEAIEKATNTEIQLDDNYSLSTYADKVSAKMATGSLPDIVCRAPSRDNMASQKAALGLYDLLMQFAPDYRRNLDKTDWMRLTDVKTYEVYSMKNIREPEYGYSFLIREDWLKQIGYTNSDGSVKTPTTWDDLLYVLSEFKTKICKTSQIMFPMICDPVDFRYTFGLNSTYYFVTEPNASTKDYPADGKYSSVVHSPYYVKYLTGMQQLINYMPEDYLTQFGSIESKMSSNLVGCTVTWAEYAQNATDALQKSDPNAKWIGFNPVTGPDGFSGVISKAGLVHDFVVNSNLKNNPDKAREVVRFLNFFYRPEGIELMNYGKKGIHFTVDDQGNKILKSEYNTFKTARAAGLLNPSMPFKWLKDSYKQMVKGDQSESTSIFYQALGIDKYNFVQDCVSLNTVEWQRNGTYLSNQLEIFEKKTITGQYYEVGSSKWNQAYESIKNDFAEVSTKGAEAYQELLKDL